MRTANPPMPLHRRLALLFVGLTLIALTTSGIVGLWIMNNTMMAQIDEELTSSAKIVGQQTLKQFAQNESNELLPSRYYIRVWGTDGRALTDQVDSRTQGVSGQPRLPVTGELGKLPGSTGPETVPSTSTLFSWRVITLPIEDAETSALRGAVTIGLPMRNAELAVRQTSWWILVVSTGAATVAAMITVEVVRRSVKPLRKIEEVAGRIAGGDLTARIPPGTGSTEVASLSRSLNKMLVQIEQAVEVKNTSEQKMRRFLSDASHELRTPLASLRGYAELYRMGGIRAENVPEVMERFESESTRMGRLVEELLQLARLDEGVNLTYQEFDLARECELVRRDLSVLCPQRPITVTGAGGEVAGPVPVVADRDRIHQVLVNLTNNAVEYTDVDTPIELGAWLDDGDDGEQWAVLCVRDHGEGIEERYREQIFERFFRVEESRVSDGGGQGLGLAIVAGVTKAHGGSVRALETPGGGTSIEVRFPSSPR